MDLYKELEKEYAIFDGSRYAVSCSTGTAALHLALLACDVGSGDEVIVPDFTMAACGFAVAYTGAKVVTVDCGDDLNINTLRIEEKITPKTKAIMAVHIYGRLCHMREIMRIAKENNLKVIEDACEAQGAVYESEADITCYSFYRNKIIHAEEGGMCTTNKKKYADRMNYLKNMAFGDKHDYFHEEIGYNYRMSNSQAKLALRSLRDYDKEYTKRRMAEGRLWRVDNMPIREAVWVFDIDCGKRRDEIKEKLENAGIATRYFFKPLSTFPMFKQEVGKNALRWSKRGLYIPNFKKLTNKQINFIDELCDMSL